MLDILKRLKGEIEYVRKPTSQLVCACSEEAARDAVWGSRIARVNTFKCFTHVGHEEGEPTVFGSGPRRWHCIVLKAHKEVVSFVWK